MNLKPHLIVIIAALFVSATLVSAVPTPEFINYEGVLRDSTGAPLGGSHDMTFRFFNKEIAGVEILVDAHTVAAGTEPVKATGGLFNVALGSGIVSDGSGVLPNDPYTSLHQVFADFSEVWIEIQIGSEVLTPRVQMLSAGYAINANRAETLDGIGAAQLLRSDLDDTTVGTLRANILESNSNIVLNTDELPDPKLTFFTGEGSTKSLTFDTARFSFDFDASVNVRSNLRVGSSQLYLSYDGCAFNCSPTINFNTGSDPSGERLEWDFNRFLLTDELVLLDGDLRAGDVYVNHENNKPFGDGHIYFYNNIGGVDGESLYWNNSEDRFYVTDGFTAQGELHAQGNQIVINSNGPNANQDIEFFNNTAQTERFQWDNAAQRFEVSDDFHAFGSLTADIKNFVQNHPYRDDLEIVYTSLEGNEVTTFTRGSGRLDGGVARIELEESFRYVTNPDIGLSVHLTPRGDWSELFVDAISTSELVVRSAGGNDVSFDFVVYGLRIGYEDHPVYRPKRAEAFAPLPGQFNQDLSASPELAEHTALRRYTTMAANSFGRTNTEMVAAQTLLAAIGTRELNLDYPRGSAMSVREMNRAALVEEEKRVVERAAVAVSSATQVEPESPETREDIQVRRPDDQDSFLTEPIREITEDLANLIPTLETVEVGDVLVIDPENPGGMMLARYEGDTAVSGVVTVESVVGAGTQKAQVAFSGVVLCKVDASWGAILSGDLLQTSPTVGHAMRAVEPRLGGVVGKALEPLDVGTGLIQVLVTLR